MFFNHHRLRLGFTFFEMVMAIGLFGGIMLLVTLFSLDLADFSLYFQQDLFAKQEMQLTLSTLLTELRSVAPAANGAYPIEAAASSSLTFYADTNADGVPDRVRYFFGTSTLNKGIVRPTSTPPQYVTSTEIVKSLITSVASGTFLYFNTAYTGVEAALTSTIDVSPIRVVKFRITVDQKSSTRPGPLTSSLTVTFRNLRD
jgi:hypothetical protein